MDLGHAFNNLDKDRSSENPADELLVSSKKEEMLFQFVELCVSEGSTVCILGENNTGKTTLLKILAKLVEPREGEVHHAHNANICYFDQHQADELIVDGIKKYGSCTSPISLLSQMFPKKAEQDVRSQLVDFGLDSQQSLTYIQFLSGGERCRLCLAMLMLQEPDLLIFDEVSNHLDPESVEALAYGLKVWNGTVVMVSHDVHLIRLLESTCYVLVEAEGRLRRLDGGVDSYLNILASAY